MANSQHRVVIVGGGFGGLNTARALADADADVTLVDRTNHHLFQPLLYQVATGILPPGLIAPALRATVGTQRNTRVELVGQIAELAHIVLPHEFRSVDTTEARIVLLEGAPAVLPPFHPKLQAYTHKTLEGMGVEIRLNTLAVDMDHDSITIKGPN